MSSFVDEGTQQDLSRQDRDSPGSQVSKVLTLDHNNDANQELHQSTPQPALPTQRMKLTK